jgi:hypothetical protein
MYMLISFALWHPGQLPDDILHLPPKISHGTYI